MRRILCAVAGLALAAWLVSIPGADLQGQTPKGSESTKSNQAKQPRADLYGDPLPDSVELSPKEMESLWANLADDDSKKVYKAIGTMRAGAIRSVPFLRKVLQPVVSPIDPQGLASLIAELDSDQFSIREKASRKLEELGEFAELALRKKLEGDSKTLEQRRRIEGVLEKLELPSPEQLRALRALQVLEHLASPEAQEVLKTLSKGADSRQTEAAKASLYRLSQLQEKPPEGKLTAVISPGVKEETVRIAYRNGTKQPVSVIHAVIRNGILALDVLDDSGKAIPTLPPPFPSTDTVVIPAGETQWVTYNLRIFSKPLPPGRYRIRAKGVEEWSSNELQFFVVNKAKK